MERFQFGVCFAVEERAASQLTSEHQELLLEQMSSALHLIFVVICLVVASVLVK